MGNRRLDSGMSTLSSNIASAISCSLFTLGLVLKLNAGLDVERDVARDEMPTSLKPQTDSLHCYSMTLLTANWITFCKERD